MNFQIEEARKKMLSIWEDVHVNRQADKYQISRDIRDSWERSAGYGVNPLKKSNEYVLKGVDLEKLLGENRELIDLVAPAIEDIYSVTRNSGFCVNLTNSDGYCLKVVGDDNSIAFTSQSGLVVGSNWSEPCMGTNSHSLAKYLNRTVQVCGYEHFCKFAAPATCCASPIHDPEGCIIATLTLTGPYQYMNAHSLGMVYAAARAVEREWELKMLYKRSQELYDEANIANVHKQAILKSISEGLISVGVSRDIGLMNDPAAMLLDVDVNHVAGRSLDEVLPPRENIRLYDIISAGKQVLGEAMSLNTGKRQGKYLVSCTPMAENPDGPGGRIIILRPFHQEINRLVPSRSTITFDRLIGVSPAFKRALGEAEMAARTDSHILLLGESGVGKDMFAQAIHNASSRKDGIFMAINCGALPRELITSELFGYDEGAFTGARKGGHPGKFELGDQGTLFLDEIGEMPIDLQTTLLRVLEDRSITRLGGKHSIPINVRLISATNKDLLSEIQSGGFRQDLFFRIQVISIYIPPLRERREDIPLLIEHISSDISKRLDKSIKRIEPAVMEMAQQYDWPGNIRELRNAVERAINLTQNGVISVDLMPAHISDRVDMVVRRWNRTESRADLEAALIQRYLDTYKYNKTQVAEAMGISRSSLYRKLEKYGL